MVSNDCVDLLELFGNPLIDLRTCVEPILKLTYLFFGPAGLTFQDILNQETRAVGWRIGGISFALLKISNGEEISQLLRR